MPPPELQAELRAFLRLRTGCCHKAEDLAQESVARGLAMATRAEVLHWRGLLYRIAHNLLADGNRRQLDLVSLDALPQGVCPTAGRAAQPETVVEHRQRLKKVAEAVNALPPRCKEALERVRLDGQSYPQAAEAMGISVNAVEKLMGRAMRRLTGI